MGWKGRGVFASEGAEGAVEVDAVDAGFAGESGPVVDVEVAPGAGFAGEVERLGRGAVEGGFFGVGDGEFAAPFGKFGGDGGEDGVGVEGDVHAEAVGFAHEGFELVGIAEGAGVAHDFGPWFVVVPGLDADAAAVFEAGGFLALGGGGEFVAAVGNGADGVPVHGGSDGGGLVA